jgi:hypothetical protein
VCLNFYQKIEVVKYGENLTMFIVFYLLVKMLVRCNGSKTYFFKKIHYYIYKPLFKIDSGVKGL